MSSPTTDTRTTKELLSQWRKIEEVKRKLIAKGLVKENATPDDVFSAIRKLIPHNMFQDEAEGAK